MRLGFMLLQVSLTPSCLNLVPLVLFCFKADAKKVKIVHLSTAHSRDINSYIIISISVILDLKGFFSSGLDSEQIR